VVAALAATHGPDDVELAFADFKGGLTFSLLHRLPHCSGMVTNLADDLSLVDRMKAALVGELERRQQLLRAAGEDVQKIGQYRALRQRHPELPPMPFLVVVVDEFGELLEARPDVLDVLLSIGRTGRSLGVHLVLASQRLEIGRVRGLDSYLGYRICLRTFTAEDSMAVLGTRAAADLPALPGHGYLRTADGVVRFLTATVSGRRESADGRRAVRTFAPGSRAAAGEPGSDPVGSDLGTAPDGDSDLAAVVGRACGAGSGSERPPLWLPPLPGPGDQERLTLDDERLRADAPPAAQGLPIPVGLVDLPRIRAQLPLRLDPAALDGHVLIVGAPKSGKTTVLAAYAAQAAQVYPAPLLQFHVLDLGGGALAPLAELPNVASYVDGQDPDGVRRVILELERIVEDRPRRLRRAGASGPAAWRAMVAAGAAEGPAHTVLLLDQLASFRDRFPDLDVVLGRLVTEGPSAGVHLAMTSTRWTELPAKRLEQVSTRIELRLNDPMESLHGRVRAAAVPPAVPGRGLAGDGCLVQIACTDGVDVRSGTGPDLRAGVRIAGRRAQERWPGVTAAPLRRLADLTAEDWSRARAEGRAARRRADEHGLLLGVDEADFRGVFAEPSGLALLAYGDTGFGRSRFLTRLLTDAADRPAGLRPQVYVLDYLGAMLDAFSATCGAESKHGLGAVVAAAAYGPQELPDVLAALTDELARRQVAAAAARRTADPHDAVQRPPVWLVVDDYELVHAAARPGEVSELAGFVPYAARLGLSVVVAQCANGSGARVDPLVRRILEGSPWHLQFSVESRTELLLRGIRGIPLPPGQALLARPGRPDRLLAVLPPLPAAAPAASPTEGAGAADADPAVADPAVADPAVARPHIRLVS
jgi:DNA segregation ATPase FtsK/SpoIIIE, S-DNA-T family